MYLILYKPKYLQDIIYSLKDLTLLLLRAAALIKFTIFIVVKFAKFIFILFVYVTSLSYKHYYFILIVVAMRSTYVNSS